MLTRRDEAIGRIPGPRIRVLPAVDVLDGAAVRLRQGDFSDRFLEAGDPLTVIRRYAEAGAALIHVVDLGAARSGVMDEALIRSVVHAAGPAEVQIGGGIRSPERADTALAAGAARVVVGTAATEPAALGRFVEVAGDRLVVALDVRGSEVLSHAWLRGSGRPIDEMTRACEEAGVVRVLCTATERDGMEEGPDLELLGSLARSSSLEVIASGGVGTSEQIRALDALGIEECVVGRALLDGSLPLSFVSSRS